MCKHYRNAALLLAVLVAAACTTAPEYQPRTTGSSVGYTDLQLSPNRYRVAYAGGYNNTRDDVETSLLRRAAEVTLRNGYSHFVIQRRQTQPMIEGRSYSYGPYYYPYRYYPYWGGGWGDGWGGGWIETTYSSYAEILLLKDADAANSTQAVDARQVLVSLNAFPASTPVRTAAAPTH